MNHKSFKLILTGLATIVLVAITACSNMNDNKKQVSGIHLENLDTSAQLGNDFYQFATGGWQELNPLTAEYSRFGSFDMLAENNRMNQEALSKRLQTCSTWLWIAQS